MILQRVDEQIPHWLPGPLERLSLAQLQVQLIHGLLKALQSLKSIVDLLLPISRLYIQLVPLSSDLICLPLQKFGGIVGSLLR